MIPHPAQSRLQRSSVSPGPALPRPLRPRRLSLCCLSLFSQCCLSLLSLCCWSLFSYVCRCCQGDLSSLPRSGGSWLRLFRPGGFQVPSAPPRRVTVPSARPWWAPGPSAPPWGASVRSALPWWAPVPFSPHCLPHGPGPPSLPLFRLRSTAHRPPSYV